MRGVERLVAAGFLPIITAMRSWPEPDTDGMLGDFRELLAGIGYTRARLKILPPLQIGAEAKRTHGYAPEERVTHEMLHGYDLDQLLCTRARLVTARGVYACPILLDMAAARVGDTLPEAVAAPAALGEQASALETWAPSARTRTGSSPRGVPVSGRRGGGGSRVST